MSELHGMVLDDGSLALAMGEEDIIERAQNCGVVGGKLLCELAKIPPPSREQFLNEVGRMLCKAFVQSWKINYSPEINRAIEDVEAGLRAARRALSAAPDEAQMLLALSATFLPSPDKAGVLEFEIPSLDADLNRWIRHCSKLTGSSPLVPTKSGPRGRHKQARTKATFPFMLLVWKVARAVKRHNGHLKLDRGKQRGTWIGALDGLRPLFPQGFIPKSPSLSTIEDLQAKSNKTPLPS